MKKDRIESIDDVSNIRNLFLLSHKRNKKCGTKKKKLKFDCTRKSTLKLDTFSGKNDDSGIIKPLRGSSTPINIIKPRTGVKWFIVLDRWYSREHEIKRSIIRIYNCRGFLFSSMKGVSERDGWNPIPIIEFRSPFVGETATLEISDGTNDGSDGKSWIGRAKAGNGADIRQVEQLWPK